MSRHPLKAILLGPWSRRPVFVLRKIQRKLGATFPLALAPLPDPGARRSPLPAEGLRRWVRSCDLSDERYPWTRVFKRDFELEFLLERCRAVGPVDADRLDSLAGAAGPDAPAGLAADVKLPWEFSRGYAFALQAAVTPPGRWEEAAADIAAHIARWEDHNGDLDGINWICAMEVALRAVNWLCADALLDGALGLRLGPGRWDVWLWNSGQVIEQRLEARKVSSNHYLADLLGLGLLGRYFEDTPAGRRWRAYAELEFPRALLRQTYRDGGTYEASLPYHALVAEMALLHALFARTTGPRFRQRLERMCRVVAAGLDAGGDVFPVGDDDGGRVIPLDFISRGMGRGRVLLKLAGQLFPGVPFEPLPEEFFPRSGWWISRTPSFTVMVEFGGYGPCGYGGHAHNDTLSVLVNYRGRRIFIDPGSYLYTPDPEGRNLFRSARMHNVMTSNDREPVDIPAGVNGLFSLPGPDRPARVMHREQGRIELEMAWPEGGTWRRAVDVRGEALHIVDRWRARGGESLSWTFLLGPGVRAVPESGGFKLETDAGALWFGASAAELRLDAEEASYAPFYGRREPVTAIRAALTAGRGQGLNAWEVRPWGSGLS